MYAYAKTKSGNYCFYTDGGLYVLDSSGKKALLCTDCTEEFDLCADDDITLVCQSKEGDIFRFSKSGSEWTKSVILKSRSRRASAFGMRIFQIGDVYHLVYGLNHGEEKLVVHQLLSGGSPCVITKIFGSEFFVRRDETGCLYVICEIADSLWHFFTYRSGGWSASEELSENSKIEDVMCTGYKSFCTAERYPDGLFFKCGEDEFAVPGVRPEIVQTAAGFAVFSEVDGKTVYTTKEKTTKILNGGAAVDFKVRMVGGAEYCVCDGCRGSFLRGRPHLYLIDGVKPQKPSVSEGARLELTKRMIALESRIAALEKAVSNLCNPQ